ncbi:MAG: AAA family ATPase [Ignavibacteria bacterium]|jgi:type II secretory pathway predicted ATPase ExeA|nr:AAA family ATPase [Ignavibacteria bacterium]MCU7503591.1 AAA family ATPase [Ignavibacteria bacterium]MCU7516755.1 AAA family ATPase [Ignavibacteria bacterium]
MYWEYFNLKVNPFGITPDPKFLYLSTPHASAIEWMKMAIEQHEFGMITGEVGSGKTVLSRYLVDSLPEEKFRVAWIINPVMSPSQLLREVYSQLFDDKAPHSKSHLVKALQEGLVNLFVENKYPVVIIDEAQVIPGTKIFEELRLLSNYQTDEQNLISIILMGQPELLKKLKKKTHRAFLQRVRFTLTLNPLTEDEVESYIDHRLKVAGLESGNIFTPDALLRIHQITEGYPRPVNHLAAFSMMEAMTHEKGVIDAMDVEAAARSILYFEDSLKDSAPEKKEKEAVGE